MIAHIIAIFGTYFLETVCRHIWKDSDAVFNERKLQLILKDFKDSHCKCAVLYDPIYKHPLPAGLAIPSIPSTLSSRSNGWKKV